MQKSCPNCGAEVFPGARFCRRCGGPLNTSAGGEGTGDVSPQSPTIPLHDEARTTDGLSDDGEERASAATSRVGKAELERLLRSREDTGRHTPAAEATLSRALDRDTPAPAPAPNDTQHNDALRTTTAAHDPEVTLSASPASARPGNSSAGLDEEDLTIPVPRPVGSLETRESSNVFGADDGASSAPSQYATRVVQSFDAVGASTPAHDSAPTDEQPVSEQPISQTPSAPAPVVRAPRRLWPLVAVACAAALIFAVVFAWLAVRFLRRPPLTDLSAQSPIAPVVADSAQQFDAKLAEAESLLAQGNMDDAVARLREANALDPSNARAHRRLGELLLASGARREAIEEFRAVTNNAPDDLTAWRQLGTAQFAEGLYRDAADSYRRLVALVGEQSADANDLLSYADALRLSGRAEEARAIYERLAASASADMAGLARQHLAELAKAQHSPSPTPRPGEAAGAQTPGESEIASTAPTPVPAHTQPTPAPQVQPTPASPASPPAAVSPAEHYRRGVELWSSNRSAALSEFRAAGSPDANYYLGLSYVEGHDIHTLKRAEVVAALQHFQIAQRGQFAGQARNYAQQLEKEFDRLRK